MTLRIIKRLGMVGTSAILAVAVLATACNRDKQPETNATRNFEAAGQTALDDGDWSRAYDAFTEVIQEEPNNANAYYCRAATSLVKAREHYNLAQANATNGKIKEGQAEAAKADEFFKKATDDADASLKLDPKFSSAWFLKGVACQYQGMWNEGIEAFGECVKIDPERAEAYQRRGEIYDYIGDYMNASLDFKKASELGFSDGAAESSEPAAATDAEDFSDLNYTPDESDDAAEPTDAE